MRFYYDHRGGHRGTSMSGREWLFWNNSLTGTFLSAFLALILLPFTIGYWIATSRSLTPQARKLLMSCYVIVWCVAGIAGMSNAPRAGHVGTTSASRGGKTVAGACFDLGSLVRYPALYDAPSNDTSCPVGYEPRQGCIVTDANDPANNTGGCGWDEKPHYWTNAELNPPTARTS